MCLERSLSKKIDLVFAHAPLDTEQQPVIRASRIVDRLVVDEERVDHSAHLDQLVPIAIVAREPRDFDGGDGSDLPETHLRNHSPKPGPSVRRRRRSALILVDELDLGPAETADALLHCVLQPRALGVVHELVLRRLPHIKHRAALQSLGGDLLTHVPPLASELRPLRRRSAGAPTTPSLACAPGRGPPTTFVARATCGRVRSVCAAALGSCSAS